MEEIDIELFLMKKKKNRVRTELLQSIKIKINFIFLL